MIHKRHNYSMQCGQDAAERGIFFMHKRLLLQVFYTVIKFLWMRRLDWIFFGLLGGVWKARYLAQLLYNFGICWRLGRKVHSVWFPFLLCVTLSELPCIQLNCTLSVFVWESSSEIPGRKQQDTWMHAVRIQIISGKKDLLKESYLQLQRQMPKSKEISHLQLSFKSDVCLMVSPALAQNATKL